MSKIVLEAKDIYKHFDDGKSKVEVIKGLSLQVKAGEFVSIVGSSGSGKSTLLHALGGLEQPSQGQVFLQGQHVEVAKAMLSVGVQMAGRMVEGEFDKEEGPRVLH